MHKKIWKPGKKQEKDLWIKELKPNFGKTKMKSQIQGHSKISIYFVKITQINYEFWSNVKCFV